jgi:hypothetical protein
MKNIVSIIACFLVLSCQNIETADPAPRNTFIKFYEGNYGITASSFEIVPDGFVIVGTMIAGDTSTIVIKTDKSGNRTQDFKKISGATGKDIKPIISGGSVSEYIVIGDKIKTDPFADQVANVTISSLRGLILDNTLTPISSFDVRDNSTDTTNVKEDFTGEAIRVLEDGSFYVLGTSKRGVANQVTAPAEPFIRAFKKDKTLDWQKRYELNGRTSQNSRSIQVQDVGSSKRIIWASAIADEAGGFTNSWVGIPIIDENSVFPNYSVIGQNSAQKFVPKDIQTASDPNFGYGVVGTYSQDPSGVKGNVFFLRVYPNGSIVSGSDRYFDISELIQNGINLDDKNTSVTVDEGEALTATNDGGFVLTGNFRSDANNGNGGLDLFLIKVNALGDLVWFKTTGGVGDETPVAIREDENGNLLICGTNKIGDYATVFLMKTDKNGELKN